VKLRRSVGKIRDDDARKGLMSIELDRVGRDLIRPKLGCKGTFQELDQEGCSETKQADPVYAVGGPPWWKTRAIQSKQLIFFAR
jgi:hypothetical protein